MRCSTINDFVRDRIRRLRMARRVGLTDLAERAGIPTSSYASMECGAYRITLDNLFRILGALDAEIGEVWPVEAAGAQITGDRVYLRRLQEFRLAEVVSLSGAEGGALFALRSGRCRVLMSLQLSDFLVDRLIISIEGGRDCSEGFWFSRNFGGIHFRFFLKAAECPDYVQALARTYLINWSAIFAELRSGDRSDDDELQSAEE